MSIVISEDQYQSWKGKKVSDMDLGSGILVLDFFHNKDYIKDPWLQITIRLDITKQENTLLIISLLSLHLLRFFNLEAHQGYG